MKNRNGLALLFLLVLAVLFGGLYFAERSENAKLWTEINQYEANRFFPALDHLQEWEARLDGEPLSRADLQAERGMLNRSAISLQGVYAVRSNLQGGMEGNLGNLTNFLMRTDRQLSMMIDEDSQAHVEEIKAGLQKINAVSREVYRFDSGLTGEQWNELHEIGFLQDRRLQDWYTKVEAALAP